MKQKVTRTRPDTRSIPVADRWAGADMRVFPLSTRADGPTDQRTDKASYRVACPLLKMGETFKIEYAKKNSPTAFIKVKNKSFDVIEIEWSCCPMSQSLKEKLMQ